MARRPWFAAAERPNLARAIRPAERDPQVEAATDAAERAIHDRRTPPASRNFVFPNLEIPMTCSMDGHHTSRTVAASPSCAARRVNATQPFLNSGQTAAIALAVSIARSENR